MRFAIITYTTNTGKKSCKRMKPI